MSANAPSTLSELLTVRSELAMLRAALAELRGSGLKHGPERYTWVEEIRNCGNDAGISAAAILGIKRTVFNAADYATVVMPSVLGAEQGRAGLSRAGFAR